VRRLLVLLLPVRIGGSPREHGWLPKKAVEISIEAA
jgi:hypothetical protein